MHVEVYIISIIFIKNIYNINSKMIKKYTDSYFNCFTKKI